MGKLKVRTSGYSLDDATWAEVDIFEGIPMSIMHSVFCCIDDRPSYAWGINIWQLSPEYLRRRMISVEEGKHDPLFVSALFTKEEFLKGWFEIYSMPRKGHDFIHVMWP